MENDRDNQPVSADPELNEGIDNTGVVEPQKHDAGNKKSRFKLLGVCLLFLALVGCVVWFATKQENPTPAPNSNNATNNSSQNIPEIEPALIYAKGTESNFELYRQPLGGGDASKVKALGNGNYVTHSDTHKTSVVVVTEPGQGASERAVIVWLSQDGGKSFEQLYKSPEPTSNEGLANQITSIKFSSDGKVVVFGFLPSGEGKNTAREIDVASKTTKDLFTIGSAGLFVEGYDRNAKKLYYFTGCYNCDGNTREKFYVRDLNSDTESVVHQSSGKIVMTTAMSADLSKLLLLKGTPGEGLGGGAPYSLEEVEVSTKTSKVILTSNETSEDKYIPTVGYREGDNVPYFAQGNSVFSLAKAGQPVEVSQSNKKILDVVYADKDGVVASSGEFSNFVITHFKVSSNTPTTIGNGGSDTRLIGVAQP